MILYPTVQELTNMKQVNRYTAVIAAAKGARYLVEKQNLERNEMDFMRDPVPPKEVAGESIFAKEAKKAVSTAVDKLVKDEFKIVLPSNTPTK